MKKIACLVAFVLAAYPARAQQAAPDARLQACQMQRELANNQAIEIYAQLSAATARVAELTKQLEAAGKAPAEKK